MKNQRIYREYVLSPRLSWLAATRYGLVRFLRFTVLPPLVICIAAYSLVSFKGVSFEQLGIVLVGLIPFALALLFWPRSMIVFDEVGFTLSRGLREHSARWDEVRHLSFVRSSGRFVATSYLRLVTDTKTGPYIDLARLFDADSGKPVDGSGFLAEIEGLCKNLNPQGDSRSYLSRL
jgi:hypothetical protein